MSRDLGDRVPGDLRGVGRVVREPVGGPQLPAQDREEAEREHHRVRQQVVAAGELVVGVVEAGAGGRVDERLVGAVALRPVERLLTAMGGGHAQEGEHRGHAHPHQDEGCDEPLDPTPPPTHHGGAS